MSTELSTLRSALAHAHKLEKSAPAGYQRDQAVEERERLDREVNRARARLELGERERREREVLGRMKKEEREKRGEGKGSWYLKKG